MQDAIPDAALLVRRVRRFNNLVHRIELPAEREGELFLFTAPPHFRRDTFTRLMVAQPAFRRTRQRLTVERQQNIAVLKARFLSRASAFKTAERGRSVPFPANPKTEGRAALPRVLDQPPPPAQPVLTWNFICPRHYHRKKT